MLFSLKVLGVLFLINLTAYKCDAKVVSQIDEYIEGKFLSLISYVFNIELASKVIIFLYRYFIIHIFFRASLC